MTISANFSTRPTPDAATLLSGFRFPEVELSVLSRQKWKDVFFDSIITEYDARRLYWYLEGCHPDVFSILIDVLNPWLRDEIDHAYGFTVIYASYTKIPLDEILVSVELRKPDFEVIGAVAADPLALLLTLAYDEIITTHVYHRSIEIYDAFDSEQLSAWIRKTKKDEVNHFFSFVQKAKKLFPDRLNEVPEILDDIFKIDFEKESYTGTFVLDHNAPDFPITKDEIRSMIIPAIIKKFRE